MQPVGPHYKRIALSNTTLGVLMASIDISIPHDVASESASPNDSSALANSPPSL